MFSVFCAWMEKQDWQGKQLDKDILIQGNKIYGPDTCLFVTNAINNLLNNSSASRGALPVGVCLNGRNGRYFAYCNVNGKKSHIGMFDTIEKASEAYLECKRELIRATAMEQTEPPEEQEFAITAITLDGKDASELIGWESWTECVQLDFEQEVEAH